MWLRTVMEDLLCVLDEEPLPADIAGLEASGRLCWRHRPCALGQVDRFFAQARTLPNDGACVSGILA